MEGRIQSGEGTPLLHGDTPTGSRLLVRYNSAHKCVGSKSALMILLWSFVIGLLNGLILNPDLYMANFVVVFTLSGYVIVAVILCFYPLAGFLADTKFGRYNPVICSLILTWIVVLLSLVIGGILAVGQLVVFVNEDANKNPTYTGYIVYMSIFGTAGLACMVLLCTGQTCFTANVIQFGMDQLHDSSAQDSTLFIHWYVWLYYLSVCIGQLAWSLALQMPYGSMSSDDCKHIFAYCLFGLVALIILAVLPITLCVARQRRTWFLIEPGAYNPYRLVYKVTRFAHQHNAPLNRSAFTYDEEDIPTGLDLAKDKYGGPFTTEQVEDVKVFYGILRVLFSFGAVFFLDFAANSVLPMHALDSTPFWVESSFVDFPIFNGTFTEHIILNSGFLSPLLIVLCLPLYLCLLHPFLSHRVPGMLKRMGIGFALLLFSLAVSFFMDIVAHIQNVGGNTCMFEFTVDFYDFPPAVPQSSYYLVIQLTLSALSHMLIYTAVFEFICAQAPHSMKGLLIGLLYAIKGLYQLLATIVVVVIIVVEVADVPFPISCEFYYYLFNIAVGVLTLIVFLWVARRYKYRERDEPSNIYRYAEEYYSNSQQELYYD